MNEESNNTTSREGIRIVTLTSWQEFGPIVSGLKSKRGYVWRGQTKDEDSGWPLQSRFDREVTDQRDRVRSLKLHLDNFKAAMAKSYPNLLPKNDLDIWALGQHYSLKTPLLDWTLSPYVAAYFAFIGVNEPSDRNDTYRFVYALNRSLERLIIKQNKAGRALASDRSVHFIEKLPYPNPRFTAQRGILTDANEGNDIWKFVLSYSMKRPGEKVIVKFRIPTKDREQCLRDLYLMNIDHTSLFLDLRDVTDSCNKELDIARGSEITEGRQINNGHS